jgi:hypothetical protein
MVRQRARSMYTRAPPFVRPLRKTFGPRESSMVMDFATTDETKRTITEKFDTLASAMACNSILHAVDRAQNDSEFERIRGKVLRSSCSPEGQCQIIVVVGAGASNAACGIATGSSAAEALKKEFTREPAEGSADRPGTGLQVDFISEEINNLALQYNLPEGDFETILLALSKFYRQPVLARLRDIFARRYHPALGYEILSHLLKYRFVDAVVNFNFDEILDQSLTDELGEDGFHKIILDGHCPGRVDEWIDKRTGKFDAPLYVKPHGTASHPTSLRFTKEHYTSLPRDMVAILEKLLSSQRVILLILGHAMQSIEFNHLLRRAIGVSKAKKRSMEFYFFESTHRKHSLSHFGRTMEKHAKKDGINTILSMTFAARDGKGSLAIDRGMLALWNQVLSKFRDPEDVRGISRHELISDLFLYRWVKDWKTRPSNATDQEKSSRLEKYFETRCLVEIAMAVAKSKGFASIHDLAEGRAGTYLRLLRKRRIQANNEGEKRDPLPSLASMCEKIGLRTQGYSGSSVALAPPAASQGALPSPQRKIIMDEVSFKIAITELVKNVGAIILAEIDAADPPVEKRLTGQDVFEKLQTYLEGVYCGEEVEVSRSYGESRLLSFGSADILPSFSAFKWRTDTLMSRCGTVWDRLLVTATTGSWLLGRRYPDLISEHPDVKLALIVCDESFRTDLKGQVQDVSC